MSMKSIVCGTRSCTDFSTLRISTNTVQLATYRDKQIWNARTGKARLTYLGHAASVTSISWSPDGTRIASGDDDGIVRVWQAPVACPCAPSATGQSVL